MTRWTSPSARRNPEFESWGEVVIGNSRLEIAVGDRDLTINFYGSTTTTWNTAIEITPDVTRSHSVNLEIPGKPKTAFALRLDSRTYCIFEQENAEYMWADSNATHMVARWFVIALPDAECWSWDKRKWGSWGSQTPPGRPDPVADYVETRSAIHSRTEKKETAAESRTTGETVRDVIRALKERGVMGIVIGLAMACIGLAALILAVVLSPLLIIYFTFARRRWKREREQEREAREKRESERRALESAWEDLRSRSEEVPLSPGAKILSGGA